ncbi:PREDICTED: CDKN2A-interacting protein [Crocodylus porosus]|uniref:CDKN2A-interacting protein n=1 Tax=Crocodylus porosus TaxID=8502 RepID=UPI00093ECE93|nr:PREDICTED: CDKN2A-interacting protein [Crocodylus porosus]
MVAKGAEPLGRSRAELAWAEALRGDCEPEHHWRHRREFLLRNAAAPPPAPGSAELQRLVSLSMVWANYVFLGCRYPAQVMAKALDMAHGLVVSSAPARSAATTAHHPVAKVKKRGISSSNEGVEEPCKKQAVEKSKDSKDVGSDGKSTEACKEMESTLPKRQKKDVDENSAKDLESSKPAFTLNQIPGTARDAGTEMKAAGHEATTKHNPAPTSSLATESKASCGLNLKDGKQENVLLTEKKNILVSAPALVASKSGPQANAPAPVASKSSSQAVALAPVTSKSSPQVGTSAPVASKSGPQAGALGLVASKSGPQAGALASKSSLQAGTSLLASKGISQSAPAPLASKSGSQASTPMLLASKTGSQVSIPMLLASKGGSQASGSFLASKSGSQASASLLASKAGSQASESSAKVLRKPLTSEDAKERQPFFNRLYKAVAWKLVAVGGFSPNVNHAELLNSSIQSVKATLDVAFVPLKELADLPQNKSTQENVVCELRCKSVYLGTGCGKSQENAKAVASREALKLFLKKKVIVKICKRKYRGRDIEDLVLLDEEAKPSNLPPALRNPQEIL